MWPILSLRRLACLALLSAPILSLVSTGDGLAASEPRLGGSDPVVRIEGIPDGRGKLMLAFCTEATFLGAGCPYTFSAPAIAGSAEIAAPGVSPGRYAIQAFHDADGNNDITRNILGIPQEALGFPGNWTPALRRSPTFAEAAVSWPADRVVVRLQVMRLFP